MHDCQTILPIPTEDCQRQGAIEDDSCSYAAGNEELGEAPDNVIQDCPSMFTLKEKSNPLLDDESCEEMASSINDDSFEETDEDSITEV